MAKKTSAKKDVEFIERQNITNIGNNSEILFLYDAEKCNPNGDPDNENKPRMDLISKTNIVTDVRMKRYIRDYLEQYKEMPIFVTKPDGVVLNATDRIYAWLWKKDNPNEQLNKDIAKKAKNDYNQPPKDAFLNEFIDIRLFGATIPIKSEEGAGSSVIYIGPVQLNWGKSLNNAELMESSGITSHFASGDADQGTMGTDYRVYYSFIGFHGVVSAKRAEEVKLSDEDLKLLDEAFIKSIPLAATRSKIGQQPRMYIRVEYNKPDFYIGDLRKFVQLTKLDNLRGIEDVELDVKPLSDELKKHAANIRKIHLWIDPHLKLKGQLNDVAYNAKIERINLTTQ